VELLLQNIPPEVQAISLSASDSEEAWFEYVASDFTQSNMATIAGVKKLAEAKKALRKSKGSFLRLLEKLGQDEDKVERLFIIAKHPVLSDSALARNLPLGWTTLFALAKIPPNTLLGFITDGTVNPNLTRREAEALANKVRGSNSNGGRGGGGGGGGSDANEPAGEPVGEAEEGRGKGHGNEADGVVDGQGETGNAPAVQGTAREDIGENSQSEIDRKLARLEELEREKRQWEIRRHGYQSEVEELKAKLDETNVPHQRRLFRQALCSLQKAESSDINEKEKRSLRASATTDFVEFVRSATRDGLGLNRFDIICRSETH
jgi:hypothetical protein